MNVNRSTVLRKTFTDSNGISWYTVTHSNKKDLKKGTVISDRDLMMVEPYVIEGEDDDKDN